MLIPSLRGVRIRKNKEKIILQRPEYKSEFSINNDLFEILKLVDGNKSIFDIARELSVSEDKVKDVLLSLEKNNLINFNNAPFNSKSNICEYNFSYPLDVVYFEPTRRCNFKCIHCYASAPKIKNISGELDAQGLEGLVKQIDKIGVLEVCFTGGEPFFSNKTLELSRIFHDEGIKLGYITNGSLITHNIAIELERLKPSFIRLSFHSNDRTKFNFITGTKNYDVVLKNLYSLINQGIVPSISCTLFRGLNNSYENISQFLSFFKERGFKATDITFDEFVPDGCGLDVKDYQINEREDVEKISKAFKDVFDFNISEKKSPLKNSYCGIGVSSLCIKSNGNLTLCPVLSTPILGNLLEEEIKDVWENSDTFKYFRNKEYLEGSECKTCKSLENCFGGCKAKALTFHSNMNAVDPWMCAHLKNGKS